MAAIVITPAPATMTVSMPTGRLNIKTGLHSGMRLPNKIEMGDDLTFPFNINTIITDDLTLIYNIRTVISSTVTFVNTLQSRNHVTGNFTLKNRIMSSDIGITTGSYAFDPTHGL